MANVTRDFCGRYLLDQASAILAYKILADKQELGGVPFCEVTDLDHQLTYALEGDSWRRRHKDASRSKTLAFWDLNFSVTKKSTPDANLTCESFAIFESRPADSLSPIVDDPLRDGQTKGDLKFLEGSRSNWPSSESDKHPDSDSESEDDPMGGLCF